MFLMDEGIESLLKNAAASCDTYDDFIHFCTNARYTRSRIQRTLIHYLLNTTKDDANAHKHPECLRLLAFRRSARPLLGKSKITMATLSPALENFLPFIRKWKEKQ